MKRHVIACVVIVLLASCICVRFAEYPYSPHAWFAPDAMTLGPHDAGYLDDGDCGE